MWVSGHGRTGAADCFQLQPRRRLQTMYHRAMDGAATDITAFILAGGKSSRMGTDKAFVTLDGQTLLERVLAVAREVAANVRIVGDRAKFATFAVVVEDQFRDCGPLGGIHAALRASETELNLILAVDVPYAPPALLQYLLAQAPSAPHALVTVPRTAEGWQPLCAVYRREFADRAEQALHSGRYRIDALFEAARTNVIGEQELAIAGFAPESFRNLNTPEDVASAQQQ